MYFYILFKDQSSIFDLIAIMCEVRAIIFKISFVLRSNRHDMVKDYAIQFFIELQVHGGIFGIGKYLPDHFWIVAEYRCPQCHFPCGRDMQYLYDLVGIFGMMPLPSQQDKLMFGNWDNIIILSTIPRIV